MVGEDKEEDKSARGREGWVPGRAEEDEALGGRERARKEITIIIKRGRRAHCQVGPYRRKGHDT
jgi:hypothetical protein